MRIFSFTVIVIFVFILIIVYLFIVLKLLIFLHILDSWTFSKTFASIVDAVDPLRIVVNIVVVERSMAVKNVNSNL